MFKALKDTLVREIDSFFARDPAARSRLEVILCYPGFHAMLFYRLAHRIWKADFKLLARCLSQFARFLTGIEIHPGARIGHNLFIDHGMGVVIGETAYIGNDVTIYHGVTLGGVTLEKTIRHPQIGDGVIIGSGAQLLGPIEVGDYARIGSNAVVVSDVESGASVVGIPARPVRSSRVQDDDDHHFTAYAVPEGDAKDAVTARLEALSKQVEELQKQLKQQTASDEEALGTAECWEKNY